MGREESHADTGYSLAGGASKSRRDHVKIGVENPRLRCVSSRETKQQKSTEQNLNEIALEPTKKPSRWCQAFI